MDNVVVVHDGDGGVVVDADIVVGSKDLEILLVVADIALNMAVVRSDKELTYLILALIEQL